MNKSVSKIIVGMFLFVLATQVAPLQGQTTGSIFGIVSDTTGAVLPGAEVTVTNVDTGVSRSVITDDEGRYRAPNLALGSYEVSAELVGFQLAIRSGITLTMGREAEVNLSLTVGEISERITVSGEAPLVETTKSDLSDLLNTTQIEDLPLDGRSYTQLAVMQAGVMSLSNRTGATFNGTHGSGVTLSIQGGRPMNTGFSLDGTNIKDALGRTPGSAAGQNLGVDTIREFSVKSTSYSAEYGGSGGGMISVVSKSGTNELHGNLFWYHRNSALDARNFRDDELPPFKRNQFGFTVGGPIVKGRTFFFGSYEGLREDLSLTDIINVPTAEVKGGFLPGVGAIDIHPDVRKWLDAYPLPNGTIFDDGRGEFSTTRSRIMSQDYFMIKIDHQIGDSDSFFVRYTIDDASRFEPLPFPGYDREGVTRYQYVTIEETKILSASLLNTARFAFNRSRPFLDSVAEGFGDEFTLIKLPDRIGARLVVPGLVEFGADPFLPRSTLLNTFQFSDKLTYSRGSHSINFGMDYQRYQMNGLSASRRHGRLRFRTYEGFLTGTNVRDWQYLVPGTGEMKGWRQNQFALYLQDDMKLGPNFTLNAGLRWEFVTSPTEVGGRVANVRDYLDPGPTIGDPFFNPPKANFGPRVGLAWDPFGTGTTAIRAGFGLFHQQLTSGTWTLPAVQNEPFFLRLSVSGASFPDGLVVTSTGDLPPGTPTPIEFNPKNPYMMNWNLTLQHQLPGEMVLSTSYVGSRGVHLGSHINFNIREFTTLPDGRKKWVSGSPRLNPAFSSVSFKHFNMDSVYHAAQLRLSKRFAGGMQFQSSYTFGRNIDNVSESQGNGVLDPFDVGRQRSLSDLHAKHSWNLNYSYDLPELDQGGALAVILNGWQMSGIVSLTSGNPTSVETSFNRDRSGASVTGGGGPETPDIRLGGNSNPVIGDGRDPDNYLDGSPFILQEDGTYGNLGRNTVIGPGIATFDLSFVKLFRIDETRHFQFRSEFFNIFNRANYGVPNMNVFTSANQCGSADNCNPSSSFGRINTTTTSPRQIQLALKFIF